MFRLALALEFEFDVLEMFELVLVFDDVDAEDGDDVGISKLFIASLFLSSLFVFDCKAKGDDDEDDDDWADS